MFGSARKSGSDKKRVRCSIALFMLGFSEVFFLLGISAVKRERMGHWWPPRASNPLRRINPTLGGFDSHTFPPGNLKG